MRPKDAGGSNWLSLLETRFEEKSIDSKESLEEDPHESGPSSQKVPLS
jgi:hypothetical protein